MIEAKMMGVVRFLVGASYVMAVILLGVLARLSGWCWQRL